MKLELNYEERSLLLDSIYVRLKQIEKLILSFDDNDLIIVYTKEKIALFNLRAKIETIESKKL
jgi:hypothetical protein